MKKLSYILTVLLTFLFYVSSIGQNCAGFYSFIEDSSFELSSYNRKDKVVSVTKYQVNSILSEGSSAKANVTSEVFDEKGKLIAGGEMDIKCYTDFYEIDLKNMLSPEMLGAYKNMEISYDGNTLNMPSKLTVGMELQGGDSEITISNSGMKIMTMKININDRKVVGSEKITTPAGTFDCYKLTHKLSIKALVNFNFKVEEWYSEGIGLVRSKNYKQNGKMSSYTELTSYKKTK